MQSSHSRLPPSGAHTWVRCPGSIKMCRDLDAPTRDIEQAELGTAAHEFGERMLKGETVEVGVRSGNGRLLDQEMLDAVTMYTDHIKGLIDGASFSRVEVESPVGCNLIHRNCYGTPDWWAVDTDSNPVWIFIRDYKHGRSPVDVVDCWQLIIYAAGVWELVGKPADAQFDLGIVQPRAYHQAGPVRVWRPNVFQLVDKWDEARAAAIEALRDDGQQGCFTGNQCNRCRARACCPAFTKFTGAYCDYSELAVPSHMTPQEAAAEWVYLKRAIKALEARQDAIDSEVKAHAVRGEQMPAVDVRPGSGREVWTLPPDQVAIIGDMHSINLRKPQQVITPKQAVKAGIPREHIAGLTETPETGLKITEASNHLASLIFGDSSND